MSSAAAKLGRGNFTKEALGFLLVANIAIAQGSGEGGGLLSSRCENVHLQVGCNLDSLYSWAAQFLDGGNEIY
jgi:hypothetical protein